MGHGRITCFTRDYRTLRGINHIGRPPRDGHGSPDMIKAGLRTARLGWCRELGVEGMRILDQRKRYRDLARTAALASLALLAAGCSGGSMFGGPSVTAPSAAPAPAPAAAPSGGGGWLRDDFSSFFSSSSANAPQPVVGAAPNVECPYIQIREGASTLTVSASGDNAAMSLKYQGTFVRGARQCSVVAGQMVMKVGVEGRVVLGPAGGPGQVDVPLRIAIVDQKPGVTKPIVTKLIMIPVVVRSADDNPTFTHVEDGLSFPLPSPASELENYIVYIGFDPLAAETQTRHEKSRPKHKPRPTATPPSTD